MDISFIIPAFNEENLIGKCIDSIQFQVFKSNLVDNYEIIVVDNNSTDKTAEIAQSKNVMVIKQSIKGVTNARQAGFKVAKYEIQAYIDADNWLPDGWLNHVRRIEENGVIAITGPVIFDNQSSLVRAGARVFYSLTQFAHQFIGATIQGGNFVARKSALEKISGHSTNILFYGEDTDLAVRLSAVGRIILIPEMWIHSSDRRLAQEGALMTGLRYTLNYLSIILFGKPVNKTYNDIRPKS